MLAQCYSVNGGVECIHLLCVDYAIVVAVYITTQESDIHRGDHSYCTHYDNMCCARPPPYQFKTVNI